jgi:glycosyltransferase involved in cell wall biosynthesis
VGKSASIYFFSGDFADVLKRHAVGDEQIYATHDEVARLCDGILGSGVALTIYSFITPEAREEQPLEGLRIISLGARNYNDAGLLRAAVRDDRADAIVAHFAAIELLRAVKTKDGRAMAVLANSYNRKGPKAALERWRVARLLNSSRFELVSNHCLPATTHLANIGVDRRKLIPWDVQHRFNPTDHLPKNLAPKAAYQVAYAGTIRADKGVADLIHAANELKRMGIELQCLFAGAGEVEEMEALGNQLGIANQISFLGLVPNSQVFGIFRRADLVIVASHTEYPEGFPLTMFEAIASRTPIVCSDHPMFAPVMKNDATAVVFPSGNPKALAAAIARVLTNAELYGRLSRNSDLSWKALQGPADWRTMLTEWIVRGTDSDWISSHMLDAIGRRLPAGLAA